jgi:type I restriction enzyme S subunit
LWTGGPGALNQHLFTVTSDAFQKWYCYLWILEHLEGFRQIAAGKATTMGHIQRYHLAEARVLSPPRPLLDQMDGVMSPLVDAIISRGVECRTLEAVRDALLPKLISGEMRVPYAERVLEEAKLC